MISQKQMKEWIPEAVAEFQAAMPPIGVPYPEIHIVTDATMDTVRDSVVEKIGTLNMRREPIAPYMETLHGPGGDAILIYQKRFSGTRWTNGSKEAFKHYLWHEHGHFYVTNSEDQSFGRFLDQQPHPDEYEALRGYYFWSEFIAEVIACKVSPAPSIDWNSFSYYPIRNKLAMYANNIFRSGEGWYDLAFYYATLLADKTTVEFIKAAKEGAVKVKHPGRLVNGIMTDTSITFEEAKIDPAGMDSVDDVFKDILADFQEFLESLLSEKEYWIASLADLECFGRIIIYIERLCGFDSDSLD